MTRRAGRLLVALCGLWLSVAALSGCEQAVTKEEVLRWDNTEQLPEKMESFILHPEAPYDAQLEAVRLLVIRGFSPKLAQILPELDDEVRLTLALGMLPILENMSRPEQSWNNRVRAKDGAFYIAQRPLPPKLLTRYRDLLERWLDGGNYHRKPKDLGHVFPPKILDHFAATEPERAKRILHREFKRVVKAYIDSMVDCGNPQQLEPGNHVLYNERIRRVTIDMQAFGTELATHELDAIVVRELLAGIKRLYEHAETNKQPPFIPRFSEIVFATDDEQIKRIEVPEVLEFAEFILKTEPALLSGNLEILKEVIVSDFFFHGIVKRDPAHPERAEQIKRVSQICNEVMQQRSANAAYIRWKCANFLLSTRLEVPASERLDAVSLVFDGLVNQPDAMHLAEDHPFSELAEDAGKDPTVASLDPNTFLLDQLNGFCLSLPQAYDTPIYADMPAPESGEEPAPSPEDQAIARADRDRAYAFIRRQLDSPEPLRRLLAVICMQPSATGTRADAVRLRMLAEDQTDIRAWRVSNSTLGALAADVADLIDPPKPEPAEGAPE